MLKKIITAAVLTTALVGCASKTTYIDPTDKETNVVAGLSYADFNSASMAMTDDIINNQLLNHPDAMKGGRYVLYVNTIVNDTMQRIDTDQLTKSMRIKLLNSGKFLVTTAFGEDDATTKLRQLKDSKMVKQSTVKGDNQVYAPDFSLSGKIIQRDLAMDNGKTRIEYYFQLSLTNIENGMAYWEGEQVIGKVSDGRSVSW